jgi:hypothetical protein
MEDFNGICTNTLTWHGNIDASVISLDISNDFAGLTMFDPYLFDTNLEHMKSFSSILTIPRQKKHLGALLETPIPIGSMYMVTWIPSINIPLMLAFFYQHHGGRDPMGY